MHVIVIGYANQNPRYICWALAVRAKTKHDRCTHAKQRSCSAANTSKQRVLVFKSGGTGTSSFDLQGLINKAMDIDVYVYSNSTLQYALNATSPW